MSSAMTQDLTSVFSYEQMLEDAHSDVGKSQYSGISVIETTKPIQYADSLSYTIILKYCLGQGFYGGVYELNFYSYLKAIQESWSSRRQDAELENIKIWIASCQYLVIYNLSLVRFGDFESQTLLSIFQERSIPDKYTVIILESGDYSLLGKPDSAFFAKLKKEMSARGVRV